MDGVRTVLLDNLPKSLWGEAWAYTLWNRNRAPTKGLTKRITPYEALYKEKPDLSNTHAFGTRVYIHKNEPGHDKRDPRATLAYFVGYASKHHYRVYDPERKVVITSRDVHFLDGFQPDGKQHPSLDWMIQDTDRVQGKSADPSTPRDDDSDHSDTSKSQVESDSTADDGNDESSDESEEEEIEAVDDAPPTPQPPVADDHYEPLVDDAYFEYEEDAPPLTQSDDAPPAPQLVEAPAQPEPVQAPTTAPVPTVVQRRAAQLERQTEAELRTKSGRLILPNFKYGDYVLTKDQKRGGAKAALDELDKELTGVFKNEQIALMAASALIASNYSTNPNCPRTYRQAMARPDRHLWVEACDKEIASIKRFGVFEMVNKNQLPQNTRILPTQWVLVIKHNITTKQDMAKARAVVGGHRQLKGTDYKEIYAPTTNPATQRAVLSMAAQKGWHVHQMDVNTAFLHANMDEGETVFVYPPEGYGDGPDMVWKLKRPLYGLHQAPRRWYHRISKHLEKIGFLCSAEDHALFVKIDHAGQVLVIITVYVDDLTIAASTMERINETKEALAREFDMKDLGPVDVLLGMKIERNWEEGTISLHQHHYIDDILQRFGMDTSKPLGAPIDKGRLDALRTSDAPPVNESTPYRELVGMLLYLALCTRPDLAYAIGVMSRYVNEPNEHHWRILKDVLRYVKRTHHYKLTYGTSKDLKMVGYADASWGGPGRDVKSTSGYVFKFGGGAISWKSARQASIALSSQAAEIHAVSQAGVECLWLKSLLRTIGCVQMKPKIYCDNAAAVSLMELGQYTHQNKAIGIRYHWIMQQCFDYHEYEVVKISTKDMAADVLTKPLGPQSVVKCSRDMGLTTYVSKGSVEERAPRSG
jgi:hypothetical protein